jgi:SAM-dependent methyltransferase
MGRTPGNSSTPRLAADAGRSPSDLINARIGDLHDCRGEFHPTRAKSIANSYSAWAATCDTDRNLTRDLDAELTCRLIGPGPVSVLVEAGCGTGKNTRHFSQIAAEVHALDFSAGMLEVARRRAPAHTCTSTRRICPPTGLAAQTAPNW